MARIYGLNGALRGKQGNNVFSIQNGTQVVKAYQPVVANPRTFLQVRQRSKFALAGKFSAVVPSGAIVGLEGSSARARRSKFVSLIARAANFTLNGQQLVASVAAGDVVFSMGSLPRYSRVNNTSAAYQGTGAELILHVSVNGFTSNPISSLAPTGYGELIIVCMFDPSGSRLDACQFQVRTDANNEFDFRVTQQTGALVAIYCSPFCPIDGASALRSSGALYGDGTNVSLDLSVSDFLAGYRWGNSVLVTTRNVQPVASMIAPSNDASEGDGMRKKK